MSAHENLPKQLVSEQQPVQSLPEHCLHCPILQHCFVEIEAIQELPPTLETKAIMASYIRFYSGVLEGCDTGTIVETKRSYFATRPNNIDTTCGSAKAKLHRDIRTARTPEIK